MKKYIFNVLLLLVAFTEVAAAQNVGEMFISMPDSLIPYITSEQRMELIKMKQIDPNSFAEAKTIFKTNVLLTKLTDEQLSVEFGEVVYNLSRLRSQEGTDSVYCMLRTFATPEKETVGFIYDDSWNLLSRLDFESFDFLTDSVSTDDKRNLYNTMEFPVVEACWDENPEILILRLHFTMLTKEDQELYKDTFLQRKVKWDGKRFNEY